MHVEYRLEMIFITPIMRFVDLLYLLGIRIYRTSKIHYLLLCDTSLVTQLTSEPAENKHVDNVKGVNKNGLGHLQWVSQSLQHSEM
jgi:hypothetical protein